MPADSKFKYVPRYSRQGQLIEKLGNDVILMGTTCGPPERRHINRTYRQLGRAFGQGVIILGEAVIDGEKCPPSSMRKLA